MGTDPVHGLKTNEIGARLEKYGKNTLVQKKNRSFAAMFFSQFKSFMIILLIIAAIISGIMGIKTGEGLLDTYIYIFCSSFKYKFLAHIILLLELKFKLIFVSVFISSSPITGFI